MATQAHCAFCFETLSAHFEKRDSLRLEEVEELWDRYRLGGDDSVHTDEEEKSEAITKTVKPAAISRLLDRSRSATSSSSSLPSDSSASSVDTASAITTPASSNDSLSAGSSRPKRSPYDKYPLFVTWNTHSRSGHKNLRGCIGTFEGQELEHGLSAYALTSALQDTRFSPIPPSLLPQLSAHVTLLINFSQPVQDPLDWELGTHGIRISFMHRGRRYGATYLPDVAKEQGWTKEETLISLMHKAGWNGGRSSWLQTWKDGKGELVRYEGKAVGLDYRQWKDWRDWVTTKQ